MAKRMRPWIWDVVVFVGAFTLSLGSMGILGMMESANPRPIIVGVDLCEPWAWVFLAPAVVARAVGCVDATWQVVAVANPFFYGSMVWLTWRMVKLFRARPAD